MYDYQSPYHPLMDIDVPIPTSTIPNLITVNNSILHRLPVEIFQQMCSFVEPIWLSNLSCTCQAMRFQLSSENGNSIWYSVLPVCLWKEAEQFQEDTAISQELQLKGCPDDLVAKLAVAIMDGRKARKIRSKNPGMNSGPSSGILYELVNEKVQANLNEHLPSVKEHGDAILSSLDECLYSPDCDLVKEAARKCSADSYLRERVSLLGGAYRPWFDYKREIMGYLSSRKRCFICLAEKGHDGKTVKIWRWGILFCPECLKEYTITYGVLKKLPDIAGVVNLVSLNPYHFGGSYIFYRPEIDCLVRDISGIDVNTHDLIRKSNMQMVEKYRVQFSSLEQKRSWVRRRLLKTAQMIWEGYHPAMKDEQDFIDPEDIRWSDWTLPIPRPPPDQFQAFRQRFAPTHDLKHFLFPEYLINDAPSLQPYDPATGWLEDPTLKLTKTDQFCHLTKPWLFENAYKMVTKLTCWRNKDYYNKGYGGHVSNWINAAKQYHVVRMEIHLEAGLTVQMDHVLIEDHNDLHYKRLQKLRIKCGLQTKDRLELDQVPERPEPGGPGMSRDEYIRRDREAITIQSKFNEGVKIFNKIIRHTCVACPDTSLLFYPMGFEGLVEHMRTSHPRVFWLTDNFDTIG